MIQSFSVHISQSVLDDLRSRIRNTRWPDEIADSGWNFGSSLDYMKELAEYWIYKFDWRKAEDEINAWPNFIADLDGYKIHFLHVKGKGRNSFPLIITHGWPGSFLEMMKLIPLLTRDPDFSFDLVIPSMLGYGFSQKITEPGCNTRKMAGLWYKLMKESGYLHFGAQGGDFGAGVSTILGLRYPDEVKGIHLNYIPGSYKPFLNPGNSFTEEEIQFIRSVDEWDQAEGAYGHQHSTRPLSLAYGLNDSPIGLCGWIIEKYYGWADCRGNIENVFSKDELLAQVTLYWVTETIHSSIRLYHENSQAPLHFSKGEFVNIPVGIARFPLEAPFPPRSYIERGYNIQHWTDMPAGGHFAAMEQPGLLAEDIRKFFRKIAI
jgi:pimeloyl-ACP methyl ester carboxylesterase